MAQAAPNTPKAHAKRRRPSRADVWGLVFLAALACSLVVIWLLTVQTPSQTIALSGFWANALTQAFGLEAGRASWLARKLAHTVEFFPVGLFLALTAWAWSGTGRGSRPQKPGARDRRRLTAVVVAVCVACSFGDQAHKAFVPGREFDALDLVFDDAGYLLGVWVAWLLARRRARP